MKSLENISLLIPRSGDIIENVEIVEIESARNQEVYVYYPPVISTKGIIFPNDNIISIDDIVDVIVNKVSKGGSWNILSSEIYHDPATILGKELLVRISGRGNKGTPMFVLHGYRGYVYDGAEVGDKLKVRVRDMIYANPKESILKTDIISKLN